MFDRSNGPSQASVQPAGQFPWSDDPSAVACNLASGNIANNLAEQLTIDDQVHADTYVAAVGAIAGFAAQRSFLAEADEAALQSMQTAVTDSGRRFLFGDPLNDMLIARTREEAASRIWSVACGGAVSAGLPVEQLPEVGPMFSHVAGIINDDKDFTSSVGEVHASSIPLFDLLHIVWPFAMHFFAADFDDLHRKHGPVPQKWWGPIAAHNSGHPITEVKEVMPPQLALTIMMETAIYSSKIDPALLDLDKD